MTIQKRTLIEPRDVVGIEYECRTCGSRCLVPLLKFERKVQSCPNCQEIGLSRQKGDRDHSDEEVVALFVAYLKLMQTRKLGAIVRLEISEGLEGGD